MFLDNSIHMVVGINSAYNSINSIVRVCTGSESMRPSQTA